MCRPKWARRPVRLAGRKRIVRLAVDATAVPGSRGYLWQGSLPAGDPAADVFEGRSWARCPMPARSACRAATWSAR
jgi:hypothetical protein